MPGAASRLRVATTGEALHDRTRSAAGDWSPALVLVLVVVLLAGALFGYDQGVISGALEGVQRDFKLSPLLVEVVTSWVTLGALVGLARGRRTRRPARTPQGAAVPPPCCSRRARRSKRSRPASTVLVAGRLVVGFGVGVAAVAAPLYAAELAPAAQRGRFVSAYQLAITIGIFLVVPHRPGARRATASGASMLGISAVPGVLLLVAMLPAVESPRWLLRAWAGATKRARRSCARGRGSIPTCGCSRSRTRCATSRRTRRGRKCSRRRGGARSMIGLGLAVFQQITGINADHLLLGPDLRGGGLRDAAGADAGNDVGHRRGQRARDADRHRVHRPARTAAVAARGPRRHVREPRRGRPRVLLGAARARSRARRAGIVTLVALVVVHHLVRVLAGPGRVDGHQRDLPGPGARARGRGGDRRQLGRGVPRERILPDARRRDRRSRRRSGCSRSSASSAASGSTGSVPETKGRSLEQIEALWATPAAPRVQRSPPAAHRERLQHVAVRAVLHERDQRRDAGRAPGGATVTVALASPSPSTANGPYSARTT